LHALKGRSEEKNSFRGQRNRQTETAKRDNEPSPKGRPRAFSTAVVSRGENLRAAAKEMQGKALQRLSIRMKQLEA